ncbi:uncharacterized protein LOC107270247 isoform X5 [Cephus cinctus]|uniref:Uncharacterized protein LOC107270247 isoform X5 n=1 Tax=Cephus cinctus TaxID=211228 RepID=A0AAJ7C2T4_CEPCN|nr:uncharacterized protein LOC107270247 isoform X5 [Cephus cinctus]
MFTCLWNFLDWLEQPVTSSTPGMDGKKVVQMATPAASLQVRRKSGGDGPGVAAAVSGVRRRSGPQGLRSPAAKRPLSAPVALQGWLHKQGSEGLMLWKKRWFVLSEYCLFYYKGPEEEKLLGSILLPSYRVTVCRPEDKITRKFAFRAEHANMRTYHFAADSRESMNQWVNVLTLATLLQDPNPAGADAAIALDVAGPADGERSARPSVSSISSILNQSADDSDSGFHGFQSRDDPSHASNNNSSPNSINTVSFPNLTSNNNGPGNVNNNGHDSQSQQQPIVNGWMQQSSAQYAQPGPSQQQYQQTAQSQQNHSHQHQALLHQHYQHATQHKYAITQQQPGPSNQVQTVQPMARNFGQSLYANAPPKPKRLTNDGSNEYSTPSPDPDYRKSPVSPDARLSSKSPMSEYDRNSLIYGTRVTQPPQQSLRTDKSGLNYGYSQPQNTERRTPDTYGRSIKPRNARGNGDYEDVYAGGPQLYQRPAGPVGYTKGQAPAPIPIPVYTQQHQQQIYSTAPPVSAIMRQHRAHPPPRPHSADFLEYEATRRPQQQTLQQPGANHPNQQRRPQRPKSSLDIVNPSEVPASDGYFYSEERYAAQMRQSAVYIHQTPQHHQQQRNQSLSRATTPSKSSSNRERDHDPNENSCNIPRHHQRELHQQHIISSQPLQRHTEISNEPLLRRSLRERSYEPSARELLVHGEAGTVPRRISHEYETSNGPHSKILALGNQGTHLPHMSPSGHAATRRWSEQQFARSASARLPRTRHPAAMDREDDDCTERSSGQDSRDGERKIQQREESMKRLLEWKQRMLQSPLTRKPSGSANRGTAHNELSSYYKQQALLDLAAHEASVAEARHCRRREEGHRVHVRSKSTDGRRSVTNVSRYNSYSSDDEELSDVRRKRTRRPSHAARSPRNVLEDRPVGATSSTGTVGQDRESFGLHTSLDPIRITPSSSSTGLDDKYTGRAGTTNPGGIPPDAGYEEISFSIAGRSDFAPNSKTEKRRDVAATSYDNLRPRNASNKKPSGILKTPSTYSSSDQAFKSEGRLSTLAGYIPNESWHTSKNVQWDSKEHEEERDDKEDWDSKIDESKVIKEFSYQYITPENVPDVKNDADHGRQETMNLVQSRIRSFESSMDETSPVKEMLAMQEPLKVSPPQATEAHVSRLDSSRKSASVIRDFALGESEQRADVTETTGTEDSQSQQMQDSNNKSVKDLLADFERKSRQVRRQEDERNEEIKHRGVFSDTETLLYDTGSELDNPARSEEDEEEERRIRKTSEASESYTGTIRRKKDIADRRRKRKVSKGSMNEPTKELDVVPTSGYTRLSMTESLVTHDDQLSGESTTTSPTSKAEDPSPEEHYLPMSPRKAILDPNNDDRPNPDMMESLFANLNHEESSYVEMTQNGMGHSLLAPDKNGRKHDSGDYSTLDTPHYEFVCVADNKMEPVYMEVSQLAEKEEKISQKRTCRKRDSNGEATSARSDLPDILTTLKSDSSDADDESSKDLDSLDAPRHPRFSLSDTFRPASYYLGASRALIAELHDSSDSELVSPPPIPTSPPPLEDLDSLELQDTLEAKKVSPQVAGTRDNSSNRDSPKSWNKPAPQVESHRSPSRFSDATISSSFRDSRISLGSASGSDSVELRNPEEEARHRQMKRRPVSDEVCGVLDSLDELESLGSHLDGVGVDLDQYFKKLQARDAFNVDLYAKDLSYNSIYGFNENMIAADKLQKTTSQEIAKMNLNSTTLDQLFRYGTRSKTSSASSLPSMRVSDAPPSHQHSQSFTGDAHYENIGSFSPLRGSPAIRSETGQTVQEHSYRMQKGSHHGSLIASHSRDSSYSLTSGTASISTSVACQRPGSGQSSSMPSPIGSLSSGNHALISSALQSANYLDQRVQQQQQQQQHSREVSQDSARYSLSSNHRSSSSQDSSQYPASTSTVKANPQSSYSSPVQQQLQNDQSAPYYYSDLQAGVSSVDAQLARPTLVHTSRLPQLNNQRGDASGLNKRNDIGRMVNPIPRQMPRQIQVVDIDEARRIAAELRKTSSQFLAENKTGLVDKRNFYEADTLRRVKSTDPLPDISMQDISTRNLYPHGLRDKSGSQTQIGAGDEMEFSTPQTSHRRSRSLEGLLDDVGLQNLVEQRNRVNRQVMDQTPEAPGLNESSGYSNRSPEDSFQPEDPWEQDTLWRESLRRVSLRHARSLDNLENPQSSSSNQPTRINLEPKTRPRITRGATYVNDSIVLRQNSDESVDRPRVKRRNPNKSEEDEEEVDEDRLLEQNDEPSSEIEEDRTYERLAMDRIGSAGYVWDPENEAYRKSSPEETKHFLAEGNLPPSASRAEMARASTSTSASFELDREKLRQWDLLSSACLLQEQQRTSMADSGRGLPPTSRDQSSVSDLHQESREKRYHRSEEKEEDRRRQLDQEREEDPRQDVGVEVEEEEEGYRHLLMEMQDAEKWNHSKTTLSGRSEDLPHETPDLRLDSRILRMREDRREQEVEVVEEGEDVEVEENFEREGRNGAAASGSGSVIGRDPLPPRAVSTSQLPQRASTQPPSGVSTLPLPRTTRQQPLPVQQSTAQTRGCERTGVVNEILRVASSGDVRTGSPGTTLDSTGNHRTEGRKASPGVGQPAQRLSSPAPRVVSPSEHRMSSPSDSERHINGERKAASPTGRDGGGTGMLRQNQRSNTRDAGELSSKRHVLNTARGAATGTATGSGSASANANASASGLVQVSAGELLGRTHEELVLLLIQLRRQSATLCKAMETCNMEIEAQARLAELDTPRRLENLQKLEELKKHLMDLEKQYEKGKPLVNLVDNMVKLGSLYNRGSQSTGNGSVSGSRQDLLQAQEQNKSARAHRDRLEFNQRLQEQRLLAEERRDWDRLSPDHGQLQAKVQQLYKLDRLLQEESGTLHSLQQDKEILEKALGGLRHKLQGSRSNPAEVERYRKQQLLLERELSRVRLLLAHNSKKLEETVAENARLEQDLVVLRQKLQASRRYAGNMSRDPSGTTAALEAELRRVQQLVGDLQRQRQELSIQVRQLTEKSHSLVQQIRPQAAPAPQVHQSKKRSQSSWLETDLDSGMTLDHGLDSPSSPALSTSPRARQNGSPHRVHLPSPQYKDPPTPYKENSHLNHHLSNSHYGHHVQQNQQFAQTHSPQNHISSLSPQLREQIQQHQLKQQQLRDQIQGKGSSPIQKSVTPLYINTDPRRQPGDGIKGSDPILNGPIPPPEYVPPPPPPPSEEALMNGGYNQNDENKFMGIMQNREKQEIKTVRIVKRESERRQRDRGDRTGNIGIPLTNGLPAPGGAKRLGEDEFGGSQQFEKAQLGRVVEESPMMHAQSTVQLSELDDVQFQRSMSLPRGFGGQRSQPGSQQGPVPPPPRSDSMNALRNMMVRRHRVRFESHDASSDSTLSPYTDSPTSSSQLPMSSPNYSTSPSYSPSHQNYLAQCARVPNQQTPSQYYPHPGSYPAVRNERHLSLPAGSPGATSPNPISAQERLFGSAASITSLSESPQLSPVFKSEAAKQIIKEMTEKKSETSVRRRQIPKEKRRHYTVSSSKPVFDLEDTFSKMGMGRARDDLDMERALRPRINAPDVVRSTLSHKELKYNESTIDQLLGTPNKIFIPERYIPEQTPELSAEEKQQRLKKAEAIRKMLSETTVTAPGGAEDEASLEKSDKLKRKVAEEKRQREHILQLNQILAKQVMEKSKMVAVQALTTLHLTPELSFEDEDLSPVTPLPLYQQRENYYS